MSSDTVSRHQQAYPLAEEAANYTGSAELRTATHPPDYVDALLSNHLDSVAIADPSPRSLLLDLPDELLIEIFKNLNPETTMHGSHEYDHNAEHTEAIKSTRLACRRLCAIASYFLLDFVNVEPTEASIRRLERISEHEAVRKEIRGAHISFTMYHPDLAKSLDWFVQGLVKQFEHEYLHKELWLRPPFHGFPSSEEEQSALIAKGKSISHAWSYGFVRARRNNWNIKKYLLNAHKEYKRRFNEQQRLMKDNSFTVRIALALAKMPKIKYLMVNNNLTMSHLIGKEDIWQALRLGEPSRIAHRYVRPMTCHMSEGCCHMREGWCDTLLIRFPLEAALHLLAILPQAGVHIQDLRCRFPIDVMEASWMSCFPYYAGLRDMGKRLTHANMSIQHHRCSISDEQESNILEWAEKLLVEMLSASPLEYLCLSSKLLNDYGASSLLGPSFTAPVLAVQKQGKLRTLVLEDATITSHTLQMLMTPYKETEGDASRPKLHFDLAGVEMMDPDSWEGALYQLRGGVDNTSTIRYPNGNMGDLWNPQIRHIFNPGGEDGASEAERYIRGEEIPNPFSWRIPGVY
ncbi:hypothetical protein F5B18DRAFT_656456 [Nemania serpens]|nr:hypothetical protein F5B18DRAFT_656456 [Nemania serpens]